MLRAAHLLIDAEPKIFRDEWAEFFLDERRKEMAADPAAMGTDITRASRSTVNARAALTEAELDNFVGRGGTQYVVLGAGYDSVALRRTDLASTVVVLEVDHPSTQGDKRARLAAGGVNEPGNVRFVPIDFESQDVAIELVKAGWRRDQPTFFSWLGVTMYLSDAATFATLELVATCPAGSAISFQYSVAGSTVIASDLDIRDRASVGVAAQGEPWINFYQPDVLTSRLHAAGFDVVEDLRSAELTPRFFAGRTDGLWWPSTNGMAIARVGDLTA
jgi:methyltransferase (TIGR00027 family)